MSSGARSLTPDDIHQLSRRTDDTQSSYSPVVKARPTLTLRLGPTTPVGPAIRILSEGLDLIRGQHSVAILVHRVEERLSVGARAGRREQLLELRRRS